MKLKEIFNKIKNSKYKKEIISITVIVFLITVVITLRGTHAYYNYESAWTPIFNSKVGNFAGEGESVKEGPLTDRNTDVNIIFYTQMPDNPNKYKESKYVPASGYEVNSDASNCYPATGGEATYSNYTIKSDGTVHIEYTEKSKPTQVVCRIYYDRDKLSDVIIYAYVEDSTGDRKYNNKTYKLTNLIGSNYTKMSSYECKNKNVITTFTYSASTGFHIDTTGPNTCYAYFNK